MIWESLKIDIIPKILLLFKMQIIIAYFFLQKMLYEEINCHIIQFVIIFLKAVIKTFMWTRGDTYDKHFSKTISV